MHGSCIGNYNPGTPFGLPMRSLTPRIALFRQRLGVEEGLAEGREEGRHASLGKQTLCQLSYSRSEQNEL